MATRTPLAAAFLVLPVLTLLCVGCGSNSELVHDVTSEWGIDFQHSPGEHEQAYFMPQCVGSGAAFFDYDNDGRLDIYLLQNGGPNSGRTNKLYRQQANGTFKDVTMDSGLDVDGFAMGVATGDVNNDGLVDVLVSEYGRTRLFQNRTSGSQPKFVDVSTQASIENNSWGTSVCFFDYNRDGWLDIVLVNYLNYDPSRWCADGSGRQDYCGPDAFPGRASRLFRNLGDADQDGFGDVKFEDVTISSGLGDHLGPGLAVFCADFDGDRWPDIFIANDGKPNHLWMNKQDGTFTEEAVTRGLAYNSMGKSEADMGIAIGDVDGNGLFDIFVTHLTTETHTLWIQQPRGVFSDKTVSFGLTAAKWRGTGFGTVLADLDNDGDLDLVLVNGRVARATSPEPKVADGLAPFWVDYAERDQILLNDGSGKYVDVSSDNSCFSEHASVSRGLACADFNNDGALDLLVTRVAGPPGLYQNRNVQKGNWLLVRAIDPRLKRDAYGAEIYVSAGKTRLMRWINPGYSYLCSHDARAHFGLGKLKRIDQIDVVWPDGDAESFPAAAANQQIVLEKGKGTTLDMREVAQHGPGFFLVERK